MDIDMDKMMLVGKDLAPFLGSAFGLMLVAHILLRIPAAVLESVWLDALLMRFACSMMQLTSAILASVAVSRAIGIEGSEGLFTTMMTSSSVVLGLASQEVLSNFAAGVVLIFTRPFEVGDNVSVAGTGGVITALTFFNTKIVTSNNEGVTVPNKSVAGGALQNNSDNYNQPGTPSLREVNIEIHINARADVERAITALEAAAKTLDAFVAEQNASKTKKRYDNGTHTLAEFHKVRYGTDIVQETKANPTAVFVGGQKEDYGHYFELRGFCDQTLYWGVFQKGYREAIKELKKAGVELYDPQLKHT